LLAPQRDLIANRKIKTIICRLTPLIVQSGSIFTNNTVHVPGIVKLWESSGKAGGLPILIIISAR
jgi:hypothetical protein